MQRLVFMISFIVFIYSTENVFCVVFIYYTYLNSLNSDTVSDKGIKPTVKYQIIPHNAQGLFSHNIPLLFLYTVLKMYFCCFIYYTYVNSLNSDTFQIKGIKQL